MLLFAKKIKIKSIAFMVACLMFINLVYAPAALSITFKEEQVLGDEVLEAVFKYYQPVKDPYVSAYINDLGHRLLGGLPPQPFEYSFYVINDHSYNAFAIPAGRIFVHSGLIINMDDEAELAGVMSHEIAHVTSRHISGKIERASRNQWLALGGMLAAVLLGMAGSGDGAQVAAVGTMGALTAAELSYSREDELQADQVGMKILANNGYTGEGMLKILGKMRAKQWWGPSDFPAYLSSHPGLEDRMATISTWMGSVEGRNVVAYEHDQAPFNYAKTRLIALYGDPKIETSKAKAALEKNPNDVDARYRYALLLNRAGQRNQAIQELSKVLQSGKYNGFAINDLGRIYFESGNFEKAQELLEQAATLITPDPENRVMLSRIYLDEKQYDRAEQMLIKTARDYPDYVDTYYFLAQVLGQRGKTGWAHFYMGKNLLYKMDFNAARRQFDLAYRNAGSDAELQRLAQIEYDNIWRRQFKAGENDPVRDPIGGPGK